MQPNRDKEYYEHELAKKIEYYSGIKQRNSKKKDKTSVNFFGHVAWLTETALVKTPLLITVLTDKKCRINLTRRKALSFQFIVMKVMLIFVFALFFFFAG